MNPQPWRQWRLASWHLTLAFLTPLICLHVKSVNAQIMPDNTLGNESSVVRPNSEINGKVADLIEGGATRGNNLFHSFLEFSIGEGSAAYFANPEVIENIFSRVTAGNPSHLFGTLGVLGNANLFLINPNGIIFGPNASLDIRGTFVGTTAEELIFPDGHKFSATNPQAIPLLTINVQPTTGLQFGEDSGTIITAGDLNSSGNITLVGNSVVNRGNLSAEAIEIIGVGSGDVLVELGTSGEVLNITNATANITSGSSENGISGESLQLSGAELLSLGLEVNELGELVLKESGLAIEAGDVVISPLDGGIGLLGERGLLNAANNLKLINTQVGVSGDLSLYAGNRVLMRDSVESPLLAVSGEDLLIQGNHIDISALNHPDSGLFAGGDLTFSSPNPVIGDTRDWSGEDFPMGSIGESLTKKINNNSVSVQRHADSQSSAKQELAVTSSSVVPDDSLGAESSEIEAIDESNERVVGGAQRGVNLFHSFLEFNIATGRGVYFANPVGIDNILARVTGNNISEIRGTLGVEGNANLYFINPNGLFFNQNASLDLKGSFFASTAEAIAFDNFEYSAVNPNIPPILVGANGNSPNPTGLRLGNNPGDIVIQEEVGDAGELLSTASGNLFQVNPGESLTLVGGNVSIKGVEIKSPGTNIQISGLQEPGVVTINPDLSLSLPEQVAKADVSLINQTAGVDVDVIDVGGNVGGSITINARNIGITGGLNSSVEGEGIDGGRITLTADGNISTGELNSSSSSDSSGISGNGGAIALHAGGDLSTGNLNSSSGSFPESFSLSSSGSSSLSFPAVSGDGGAIALHAGGDLSTGTLNSSSSSSSFSGVSGDGGAIALHAGGDLSTASLSSSGGSGGGAIALHAGGDLSTASLSSFSGVSGDGGAITLHAGGDLSTGFLSSESSLFSLALFSGESGDGGAITLYAGGDLSTGFLHSSSSSFSSSSAESGDGGAITL